MWDDPAVALVCGCLRVNGYFTLTEFGCWRSGATAGWSADRPSPMPTSFASSTPTFAVMPAC